MTIYNQLTGFYEPSLFNRKYLEWSFNGGQHWKIPQHVILFSINVEIRDRKKIIFQYRFIKMQYSVQAGL